MDETIGLGDLSRTVSALISIAATIILVWWVEVRHHDRVPAHYLKQARKTAQVLTAAAIAFLFWLAVPSRVVWLSIAGAISVAAFVVCYVLNLRFDLALRRGGQRPLVGYVTTLMAYIAFGSMTVVAAGLFYLVTRHQPGQPLPIHDITVTFSGTRAAEAARPLSFRVSSAAVTVGCDQRRTVTAAWEIPPGATITGAPAAEWINLRRARAEDATTQVERRRVVARGQLRGPDTDRVRLPWGSTLGTCGQAGSGELTLSGRYLPRGSGLEPFTTELQNHIEGKRGSISLTLPASQGVTLKNARIRVSSGGRLLDEGVVSLVNAATTTSPKTVFTARTDGATLLITLIDGDQ